MDLLKRVAFVLAALLVLLMVQATGKGGAMSKTISGVSDPFTVSEGSDYIAGGSVKTNSGSPTFIDSVSWYSDNAATTLISTTTIYSGTATASYSDNTWRVRVTVPATSKAAKRNLSGTATGSANLKWGPITWREAPDTVETAESGLSALTGFKPEGEVHFSTDGLFLSRTAAGLDWSPYGPIWHLQEIDGNLEGYDEAIDNTSKENIKRTFSYKHDAIAGYHVGGWERHIDTDTVLTFGFMPHIYDVDYHRYGLFASTDDGLSHGSFIAFSIGHNGSPVMEALTFTDHNTLASTDKSVGFTQTGVIWMRITSIGSDQFEFRWSRDKQFWNLFYTSTLASVTKWGMFIDANNADWPMQVTVLSQEHE